MEYRGIGAKRANQSYETKLVNLKLYIYVRVAHTIFGTSKYICASRRKGTELSVLFKEMKLIVIKRVKVVSFWFLHGNYSVNLPLSFSFGCSQK